MQMRTGFRKSLREVQDDVLTMGSMVDAAICHAMASLKNRDLKLAKKVIANDVKVNSKRFEIEEKCIHLIVTQQPMAGDLRIIIGTLNIISELERIGDYAVGTARVTIMIGDEPPLKPLIDLPRMADKTVGMLRRSLTAFINSDADLARKVCSEDEEVDNLYDQVRNELILFMVSDPKTITRATRLMWVGHNMERSADRVTNICERVVYLVTGKMEEIGASRY